MLEPPLIKLSVPLPRKLYKLYRRRARTIDEVEEEYFPGFKAFIDSSEQEIPRPKSKRKRKSYYSGKKKKHTVKILYYCTKQLMIREEYMITIFTNVTEIFRHTYIVGTFYLSNVEKIRN